MSIVQALLGFGGRLNRRPYWIGGIVLAIAALVVAGAVGAAVYSSGQATTQQQLLRSAYPWLMAFTVIFAYPSAALLAKRLHDRNKSGWLAALLIVPMLVASWLDPDFSSFAPQSGTIQAVHTAASVITLLVGIWFLIELGFMRGTAGDNKYGTDPLAATAAA
jgi:uncharacterized membrane protein YhaH (DUF805 family)